MSLTVSGPPIISTDEFFSRKNLQDIDDTLDEIFGMMLCCSVRAEALDVAAEWPNDLGPEERTAIVGFAGAMRGSCSIRMDGPAILAIATAMMGGIAPEEDDHSSLCDAIGELCNMVAGGWKNRLPEAAAMCSLAPPTVISGSHYNVHPGQCVVAIGRSYSFEPYRLKLTLMLQRSAD